MRYPRIVQTALLILVLGACQAVTPTPSPTETSLPPAPLEPTQMPAGTSIPAPETETPPTMPPLDPGTRPPQVETVRQIHVQYPISLRWNSSGSQFAVTTEQGVSVYDAGTLEPAHTLVTESSRQLRSFAPDALLAALLVGEQTVEIVDVRDDSLVQSINTGTSYLNNLQLSPDGRWLITDAGDVIGADLWDVQSGEKIKRLTGFETAAPVYTVQFSADASKLIWLSRAHAQVQDVETGTLYPAVFHEDFIVGLDLSRDGQTLVTSAGGTTSSGGFAPMIYFWDVVSGETRGDFVLQEGNTAISLSPDGMTLALSQGSDIELWDTAARQRIGMLEGHSDIITLLRFSPDGLTLASGSTDNTVRLWLVQGPQL